jgi:hypothetical protein
MNGNIMTKLAGIKIRYAPDTRNLFPPLFFVGRVNSVAMISTPTLYAINAIG